MKEELECLISERFPMMRRDRHPNTDFGYGGYMVPDGWFPLIHQFAASIEALNPQDLVIYQVKEKFNRLIICSECEGSQATLDALDNLETSIEQQSLELCGRCGEPLKAEHICYERWHDHDEMIRWASNYMKAQRA